MTMLLEFLETKSASFISIFGYVRFSAPEAGFIFSRLAPVVCFLVLFAWFCFEPNVFIAKRTLVGIDQSHQRVIFCFTAVTRELTESLTFTVRPKVKFFNSGIFFSFFSDAQLCGIHVKLQGKVEQEKQSWSGIH